LARNFWTLQPGNITGTRNGGRKLTLSFWREWEERGYSFTRGGKTIIIIECTSLQTIISFWSCRLPLLFLFLYLEVLKEYAYSWMQFFLPQDGNPSFEKIAKLSTIKCIICMYSRAPIIREIGWQDHRG